MIETPHTSTDVPSLTAVLAVQRDVHDQVMRKHHAMPELGSAMVKLGAALSMTRTAGIGEDEAILYRNLVDVITEAQLVAIRLRVAHPDLRLAP